MTKYNVCLSDHENAEAAILEEYLHNLEGNIYRVHSITTNLINSAGRKYTPPILLMAYVNAVMGLEKYD